MYVVDLLKLNKKVDVDIPKPAVLFERFGLTNRPTTGFTGDEVLKTDQSKVEQAADVEKLAIDKEK